MHSLTRNLRDMVSTARSLGCRDIHIEHNGCRRDQEGHAHHFVFASSPSDQLSAAFQLGRQAVLIVGHD
jgi:hypothetical protein